MFSCNQGQTSGSNITKKMLWWNYFCNNYKDYYKNNCSKELFCNHFGQDGTQCRQSPQNPYKTSTKPRDTPLQNLYKTPRTHHYRTSTKPPRHTTTKPLQNPPTHHYKTSTKPPAHHYKTSTKPWHTTTKPLRNSPHHKTSAKPLKHYKIRGSEGFVEAFCATHKKPLQNPPNPLFCSVLGVL